MISHIDIRDFAVIKDLSIDLYPGLNIITGETGAGKSVIIEAISMALGSRADTDYIRHGCDKAVISMLIDADDKQYLLKREISQGKSVCRINGEMASLSELSSLCKGLVDIHGQYDHQSLLNPDNHLGVLDLYGGDKLKDVKQIVSDAYEKLYKTSSELNSIKKKIADDQRHRDFLKFEIDEIEEANIKPGEDEELDEKIRLMENSENIFEALSAGYNELFSGESAAYDALGDALSRIEACKDFSEDLNSLYSSIADIYYGLEDIKTDLRTQRDGISFSEEELDEAIERSEILKKLKKKYGGTIDSVLSYCAESKEKLQQIDNADAYIEELEKKIKLAKHEFDISSSRLSSLRKDAAKQLEISVNKELSELNFQCALFGVNFADISASENGIDGVEFLISANKGEDLKPLAKVASGGELSRIMLALKRIIGDLDGIPTMIFDEIDTGISGASAGIVGNKLESIAKNHQIVCITHLPQIASKGDKHFKIVKTSDDLSTSTSVKELNEEERIEELARLLSGTEITDSARAQAKELLRK